MANFNLNDYETVEERIRRFYKDNPDARITTELVSADGDPGRTRWIVKAYVFRDSERDKPDATGYAFEVDGSGMTQKAAALENFQGGGLLCCGGPPARYNGRGPGLRDPEHALLRHCGDMLAVAAEDAAGGKPAGTLGAGGLLHIEQPLVHADGTVPPHGMVKACDFEPAGEPVDTVRSQN